MHPSTSPSTAAAAVGREEGELVSLTRCWLPADVLSAPSLVRVVALTDGYSGFDPNAVCHEVCTSTPTATMATLLHAVVCVYESFCLISETATFSLSPFANSPPTYTTTALGD